MATLRVFGMPPSYKRITLNLPKKIFSLSIEFADILFVGYWDSAEKWHFNRLDVENTNGHVYVHDTFYRDFTIMPKMTEMGQISKVCFFCFAKNDIAMASLQLLWALRSTVYTLDLGVKSSINVDTFWDTNLLHLFYCFRITRGTF